MTPEEKARIKIDQCIVFCCSMSKLSDFSIVVFEFRWANLRISDRNNQTFND